MTTLEIVLLVALCYLVVGILIPATVIKATSRSYWTLTTILLWPLFLVLYVYLLVADSIARRRKMRFEDTGRI